MPLTAVMLSGTILISMITIDGSLISGLVTLLIFYYLLKIFDDENFYNVFFFMLFSLIALILNNFYFLNMLEHFEIAKTQVNCRLSSVLTSESKSP